MCIYIYVYIYIYMCIWSFSLKTLGISQVIQVSFVLVKQLWVGSWMALDEGWSLKDQAKIGAWNFQVYFTPS